MIYWAYLMRNRQKVKKEAMTKQREGRVIEYLSVRQVTWLWSDVFRCLTAFVGVYWIGVRHTSVIVGCMFVQGRLDRDQLCCDLVYRRALCFGQSSFCFTRQASSTLSRSISYFLTFMLTTHRCVVSVVQTRLLVSVNRLQPVWRM